THAGVGLAPTATRHSSGRAAAADGKLYTAPHNATDILVIDPVAGTATRTSMGVSLSGTSKWSGITTAPDGKLYCAPYNATDILVISDVFLSGLYFKDSLGYLSIPGGGILRRLSVGEVIQGTRSGHKAVKVENRTGVAIENVVVDVEEHPEGDAIELSLTDDPFAPEPLPLQLPGTIGPDQESQPIYVRVQASASSSLGIKVVGLTVSAEPVQ